MSLVLREVSGNCILTSPRRVDHGKPTSRSLNASTSTSAEDVSTASESEVTSFSDRESTDSASFDRSRKRRRRVPPSLFFGTPGQAERERIAKYATTMRERRLLRRDSLELARRKSGAPDWRQEDRPNLLQDGISKNEKATKITNCEGERDDPGTLYLVPSKDDLEQDISTLSLPPARSSINGAADGQDEEDGREGEEEEEDKQEDEDDSMQACNQTFRVGDEIEILPASPQTEDLPSTPTKDIGHLQLQPSPIKSEEDGSPGIALALDTPSGRPSPHYSVSPLQQIQSTPHHNSSTSIPFFKVSPMEFDMEEPISEQQHASPNKILPGKGVLRENTEKLNHLSPIAKVPSSTSPAKVVVRQTLSAWANAKLKTPQSPEKLEWERLKAAETSSPSRRSARPREEQGQSVKLSNQSHPALPRQQKSMKSSGQEDQVSLPPSNLAKPIPPSRLPRPISRKPLKSSSGLVSRPETSAPAKSAGPFGQSVKASAVRLSRPALSLSHQAGPSSLARRTLTNPPPRPAPGAVRAPPIIKRPLQRSLTVRHPTSSSSPVKAQNTTPSPRPPWQSSSPLKRTAANKIKSAPFMRDARLIASTRRMPDASPAPAAKKPSVPTVTKESKRLSFCSSSQNSNPLEDVAFSDGNSESSIMRPIPRLLRPGVFSSAIERSAKDVLQVVKAELTGSERSDLENPFPAIFPPLDMDVDGDKENAKPCERVLEPSAARPLRPRRVLAKETETLGIRKHSSLSSSSLSTDTSSHHHPQREIAPALPLSRAELSRLTSLHTRRNEMFVSQVETIVVRKHGEIRPASPSSKIRRSSDAASALRESKRGTVELSASAKENFGRLDQEVVHRFGAGDSCIFTSPVSERILHDQPKRRAVEWHKDLYHGQSDHDKKAVGGENRSLQTRHTAPPDKAARPRKSCLRLQSEPLDRLGNVKDASRPWPPSFTENKVTVYKLIYDDDPYDDDAEI